MPTNGLPSRKCDEKSTEVTIIPGGKCKVGSSVVVQRGKTKLVFHERHGTRDGFYSMEGFRQEERNGKMIPGWGVGGGMNSRGQRL